MILSGISGRNHIDCLVQSFQTCLPQYSILSRTSNSLPLPQPPSRYTNWAMVASISFLLDLGAAAWHTSPVMAYSKSTYY